MSVLEMLMLGALVLEVLMLGVPVLVLEVLVLEVLVLEALMPSRPAPMTRWSCAHSTRRGQTCSSTCSSTAILPSCGVREEG
ncbi:hypothetical protein GCM10009786_18210 [Leucobacter alluvii]|uniref:Secreted protein n=1 Tax=Leucobacter alluvii TaxID=340321 RepID=A0ABN3B6H9_9MICO